jgi:hypothetical protein
MIARTIAVIETNSRPMSPHERLLNGYEEASLALAGDYQRTLQDWICAADPNSFRRGRALEIQHTVVTILLSLRLKCLADSPKDNTSHK